MAWFYLLMHMDDLYQVFQELFLLPLCAILVYVLVLKNALGPINPCINPHVVGFWP